MGNLVGDLCLAQRRNHLKTNLRLGKITRIDKYEKKEINTRGKGKWREEN